MKKYNAITLGLLTWLTALNVQADSPLPAGYVSGSAMSDYILYSIGGGAAVSAPPTKQAQNVYSLGLGWKSNLMCGNFDMKFTIKNQLNGITEGFKDLYSNIIQSATGAVASLPAMIIQRANPQLYDILSNGLYQGKIDFSNLKTSCEEMSHKLADYAMDSKWGKMAELENYKRIAATEPDAIKAKKKLEQEQGRKGISWIGGDTKGGDGQAPIDVLKDVVGAGFNMALGRGVTDKSKVVQCDGLLCTEWKSPEEVAEYAQDVLGSATMKSCDNCNTQPATTKAGRGLAPQIEKSTKEKAVKLEEVLNAAVIKPEQLNDLSTSNVAITRGLIETLKQDPDAPILAARLAQELAISKEIEKALVLRRVILTGMKEPNVAQNDMAQNELETSLKRLDLEIEQVKLEMDLQRTISNNTALMILSNRDAIRANAQYSNAPDNSKGLAGLNEQAGSNQIDNSSGGVSGFPQKVERGYIPVPKSSGEGINDIYGSYSPAIVNNSTGSPSYNPIGTINGTAYEQAMGLLRKFEGFAPQAAWDVNAQRAGYGSDTTTRADGTIVRITPGMRVSQEDAERDLARRTQEFANRVKRDISPEAWDKLPANAQAVLTSYAYNYGSLQKTQSVITAAQESARAGDMTALANAIRNRQTDNNGVNARRRNQEADYILGK